MNRVAIEEGEARHFRTFTGETETDPHHIGFWDVTLSTEGLTLGMAECPEPQTASATWWELHSLLGAKDALIDDIEHLRDEQREIEAELVGLRVERRRRFHQIAELKAQRAALDAQSAAIAAGHADGSIVPLRAPLIHAEATS